VLNGRFFSMRRRIPVDAVTAVARVVEHEIDMSRTRVRPSPVTENLVRLFRWLTPDSRAIVAPMRSLAREVEEAFPSLEN